MTTSNTSPLYCCGLPMTDRYPEVWVSVFTPAEYVWVYTCDVCGRGEPVEAYTDVERAEVFEAADLPIWSVVVLS